MRKYTKRISSFNFPAVIALIAILAQNIFPVLLMNPFTVSPVYAAQPSLEAQKKDGSYTTGNVCGGGVGCYAESEWVPFRVTLPDQIPGSSSSAVIKRDWMDGANFGYEDVRFSSVTGATNVNLSSDSASISCGGSVECKENTFTFDVTSDIVEIYFDAKLGVNASEWSGASLQMRLSDTNGDKTISINPKNLLKLPSLTIEKSFRGEDQGGTASDWCFNISPTVGNSVQHCITGPNGDGVNSVTLDNLTGTSYTITEVGPEGFVNVDLVGTNCVQTDNEIATATVAPGVDPTNASCTFINSRALGRLKVYKEVLGPNGEDIFDDSTDFGMTLVGGESFSLTDGEMKEWLDIPTGEYTIVEDIIPDGYKFSHYSKDSDPGTDGAQVVVTSGQETVLTVTNNQVGGTLHVTKQVLDPLGAPTEDSETFQIKLDEGDPKDISDGETVTFPSLLPGSHTLLETSVPTGYQLLGFRPDDDPNTDGAQLMIPNNKEIYVTVTNQQDLSVLEVSKSDDVDPVPAGGTFKYTIEAENKGPHSLHRVAVRDVLPVPFELESVETDSGTCVPDFVTESFGCDIGDIQIGQKATVTVTVNVPSDTLPAFYENTAYISAYEYREPLTASETTEVIDSYDLKVRKTASVERIYAGDPNGYNYTIEVYNVGPSMAESILLVDSIPAILSIEGLRYDDSMGTCDLTGNDLACSIPQLDAEESFVVVVQISVPYSADSQRVVNEVIVGADDVQWRASDTVEIMEYIDLLITKSDGVEQVTAGEGFIYTITVQNSREALSDADGVVLVDTIPAPFLATIQDNASCRLTNNVLECHWEKLDPGAEPEVIRVRVSVPSSAQAGEYENVAYVRSDEPDSAKRAREVTPVVENSSLWVRKTDSVDPVTAGGRNFVYIIGFGNGGPSAADDVYMMDHLPPQFEYVSHRVESDDLEITCGFNGPSVPPSDPTYADRDVLSCKIGMIEPGESGFVYVEMRVPDDLDAQVAYNFVDLFNEDGDSVSVEESTEIVEDVQLNVMKWDQFGEGEFAVAGADNVAYSIKVWNEGLSTADNVVVRDLLPAEFAFVSADEKCIYSESSHMVECELGDLSKGEEVELMIVVNVGPEVESGRYTNNVGASSDEGGVRASEVTGVVEMEKMDVIKQLITKDPHVAGLDYVEYKILVRNYGPSNAENVRVTDDLSKILSFYDEGRFERYQVSMSENMVCREIDFEGAVLECGVRSLPVYDEKTGENEEWITLRFTVPDYFQAGDYENLVRVMTEDGNWDEDREDFTVEEHSKVSIEKSAKPEIVVAGAREEGYRFNVEYPLSVTNHGPSILDGAMVVDTLPAEFTFVNVVNDSCEYNESEHQVVCKIAELGVDQTFDVMIRAYVDGSVDSGVYTNHAAVHSYECMPNTDKIEVARVTDFEEIVEPVLCDEDKADVEVQENVDLKIFKDDNVEQAVAGLGFIYTIHVANSADAPSDADNVVLRDPIPEPFVPTGVDNDACSLDGQELVCKWRKLEPGAPREVINVTVRIPSSAQAGEITNIAGVSSEEPGSGRRAQVTTPLVEESSLWIRKSELVDPVVAGGDDLVYVIGYGNNGPSDADSVVLVDHLPDQFGFESYRVETENKDITCEYGTPVLPPMDDAYDGRSALSCKLGNVVAGEMGKIYVTMSVPEDLDAQTVYNYADILSRDGDKASVEESTDVIEDVKLIVAKWDQYDPGQFAVAGADDVIYTIKVWNEGLSDADNVIVTDQLPEGFTFESADERCKYQEETHEVTCELGSLPGGEENAVEILIVTSVDPDIEPSTCKREIEWLRPFDEEIQVPPQEECGYRNDVLVESDEDETSDSEWTRVARVDQIRVNKSLRSDDPHIAGRDTVKFRVVVKNLGPSYAQKVEMWDDLSQILMYYEEGDEIEYTIKTSAGMTCEDIDFDNDGIYCEIGQLGVKGFEGDNWKEWMTIEFAVPEYFETGRYTNIAEAWSGGCYEELGEVVPLRVLGQEHEGNGIDDTCSWDEDKARFFVEEESNIVVEKEANPTEVMAGHPVDGYVDYPVTITNEGPSTVEDIMGVDYLPQDFTYVSNDNDWCEYDEYDHAVYCTIESLDVGEVFEFSVRVFVEVDVFEGEYTNTAMAFSHECVPMDYDWGDGEVSEEEEEEGEDFGYVCDMDEEIVTVVEMPDPVVDIVKTNSWLGSEDPLSPGDTVDYKITVGVHDYPVRELTIYDLLPPGISYVPGTGQAVIDGSSCLVRPNQLQPAMSREFVGQASVGYPDYVNGIGMWFVGSLDPCQKVILTYQGIVDNNATPGELRDISWAKAKTIAGDPVFANAIPEDPSYVAQHVVGTYIAIATPTDEGGEVLGASTSTLPATGIPTYQTLLAIISIIAGTILIFGSQIADFIRRRKSFFKGMTYMFVFLMAFMAVGLFVSPAEADAQVAYVELSPPKSPTSNNTFNISYVASSLEGDDFNVVCKVSKDGGAYTTFDSGSHSVTGTGSCAVTPTTISSEGSYAFKAIAELSGGSTVESNVVTVAYDNTSPEAPTDYAKETYDACSNQVTFTVPAGSGIVEVRVYRSTSPQFTANADTLIITRAVSEGEQVTLRDDITDCSQKYYYAMRAIDGSGNSSEYTGDHTATVTQVAVTDDGAVVAQTTTNTDGEPELIGENGEDGEVLGEGEENADSNDENGESGENGDENGSEEDSEESDRESTSTEDFMRRYGIFLAVGVGLIIVGFYLYRRSVRSATV